MSATATTTEQEFRCSCGRTFAHEISLKRHRWVTGHAEGEAAAPAAAAPVAAKAQAAAAPVAPKVDAEETYRQALAVITQKRFEYEAAAERERQAQARKALVAEFVAFIQSGIAGVAQAAQRGGRSTSAALSALAALTFKLVCVMTLALVLVFSGMGVGRLIATQADAQAAGVSAPVADASR